MFEIPVRIYFQDTDAGGVVFHSTYLDFMERARTEWLRAKGFESGDLAHRFGLLFIVRRLEVAYVAPALLDDLIRVSASVAELGRAQMTFAQSIQRGDETLARATVNIACVAAKGLQPIPIPAEIRGGLASEAGNIAYENREGAATPFAPRLRLRDKIRQI
ncbi:MAG: tol-pal system-associated acyl-CoA thioesterase [Burkholderiales bacterium]